MYQIYPSRRAHDPELQADKDNRLFSVTDGKRKEHLELSVSKVGILIVFPNSKPSPGFINSVWKF